MSNWLFGRAAYCGDEDSAPHGAARCERSFRGLLETLVIRTTKTKLMSQSIAPKSSVPLA